MGRLGTSYYCTLWVCVAIITLLNIGLIIGGDLGSLLFIIFINLGAIALTIYFNYTPGSKKAKKINKILQNQMIPKRYEKDKYVICPKCKHLVDNKLEFCQNCGNPV